MTEELFMRKVLPVLRISILALSMISACSVVDQRLTDNDLDATEIESEVINDNEFLDDSMNDDFFDVDEVIFEHIDEPDSDIFEIDKSLEEFESGWCYNATGLGAPNDFGLSNSQCEEKLTEVGFSWDNRTDDFCPTILANEDSYFITISLTSSSACPNDGKFSMKITSSTAKQNETSIGYLCSYEIQFSDETCTRTLGLYGRKTSSISCAPMILSGMNIGDAVNFNIFSYKDAQRVRRNDYQTFQIDLTNGDVVAYIKQYDAICQGNGNLCYDIVPDPLSDLFNPINGFSWDLVTTCNNICYQILQFQPIPPKIELWLYPQIDVAYKGKPLSRMPGLDFCYRTDDGESWILKYPTIAKICACGGQVADYPEECHQRQGTFLLHLSSDSDVCLGY